MRKALLVVMAAAVSVALLASSSLAATRTFKFTNNTGVAVNDLHIVTNQGITVTSTGPFTNDGGVDGGNTHDLDGGSVANGGTATIATSSTANKITVQKWWWTIDGDRKGDIHNETDDKKTVFCAYGVATGDGEIEVSCDGQTSVFETTAGFSPDQTAAAFELFCDGLQNGPFDLIETEFGAPNWVICDGAARGDPQLELKIAILTPDSSQGIRLTTVVPTLSEWGMILLLAFMVGSGAFMILRRRQPRLA